MSGKVLIVDDDASILRGMTMLLESEGIEAFGTTSPFEVPHLLRREKPALVLLDLKMPAMRGEKMLGVVRQNAMLGDARVVLFSGSSRRELSELAESVGADGFICKSDDAAQIVRHIQFWLRQMQRKRGAA